MSLYDALQEKLEGRLYSNYFACLCPFHDDSNPSCFVYEDGRFRCASCGKSGTHQYLDKVIGSHLRLTRSQVGKSQVLPRWRDWEKQYGDIEGIAHHAHKALLKFPQFQSYFRKRKIDEYIEKGKFGYLSGWNLFPIFAPDGRVIDIVVRAGKSKGDTRYVLRPDSGRDTPYLYSPSWDRIKQSSVVYVVYGIIDAWTMESLGLACVTGTAGKSLPAESLKPLNKRFIIIPDSGEERESRLLANSLGWRCKAQKISYPDGTKDVDEIRMKFGNQYLLQLIGA